MTSTALIFANTSHVPFNNNVLPIINGFRANCKVHVVDTYAINEIPITGGSSPAKIPSKLAKEKIKNLNPSVIICIGAGLYLENSNFVKIKKIGIALSDPLGLDASLQIAPYFDQIYTQDPQSLKQYTNENIDAKICEIGVDCTLFKPIIAQKKYDLIYYGRASKYRKSIIIKLHKHFDIRVHTYENQDWGIKTYPPLNNPDELSNAINKSRLALELAQLDFANSASQNYWRMTYRPHFAAACEVPCLIEHSQSLENYYDPNSEIISFHLESDLVSSCEEHLANKTLRKKIGLAARKRVIEQHDWKAKAKQILVENISQ